MTARRALLVSVVTLATFTATTPPARADAPPMPPVRTYDQGKPLPSYKPVLRPKGQAADPGVLATDPDGLLQIAPPPPGTKPSTPVALVPGHRRVVAVR